VELILLHELAHVRRWDYADQPGAAARETLLFYHPGVWWISARIREEREHCCDDAVVERAERARLRSSRCSPWRRRAVPVPALALGAGGESLVARGEAPDQLPRAAPTRPAARRSPSRRLWPCSRWRGAALPAPVVRRGPRHPTCAARMQPRPARRSARGLGREARGCCAGRDTRAR
jgi:hypothetical protein